MKTTNPNTPSHAPNQFMILLVMAFLIGISCPTMAADSTAVAVGLHRHTQHTAFPDLPYDDGDISYGAAIEWHNDSAYWQIALDYAPDLGLINEPTYTGEYGSADYLLTPQINLLMKDGIWRGGVGALKSYVKSDDGSTDWTSVYWQFLLGAHLPLGGLGIDVMASYPFEDWDNLSDFDMEDIDVVAWLSYVF